MNNSDREAGERSSTLTLERRRRREGGKRRTRRGISFPPPFSSPPARPSCFASSVSLFLCFDYPQAMNEHLWGAAGLTKVVLPDMLDRGAGHVVAFGGDASLSAPEVRNADAA